MCRCSRCSRGAGEQVQRSMCSSCSCSCGRRGHTFLRRIKRMRILEACEESQAVTKELRHLGHEAYSCDIQPCTGGHPEWHHEGDVLEQLHENWDMMIAFPPCTHLAVSGARHFKQKQADGRQRAAIKFFMHLVNAPIERIAIENPVGKMSTAYRPPDQIIQPYQHGHCVQKSTCLWLKNLPKLEPTELASPGKFVEWTSQNGVQKRQHEWYLGTLKAKNSAERSRLRSITFPGIARAMAAQWAGDALMLG